MARHAPALPLSLFTFPSASALLTVGLTGNVASGKSTVAEVWRGLGARVVDADVLARRAVAPGTPGLRAVAARWGAAVLDAAGALDRARLREIVFTDPVERAALEAIVHPEVARLRDEEMRRARAEGAALVVADIPLLYEVGMQDQFDVVVLVDAPEEVRIRRMVEHRGLDREAARAVSAAQMPAARKREMADVVINNDGTVEELRRRAEAVWRELERRAGAEVAG